MTSDNTSLKLCAASLRSAILPDIIPPMAWAKVIPALNRIANPRFFPLISWG